MIIKYYVALRNNKAVNKQYKISFISKNVFNCYMLLFDGRTKTLLLFLILALLFYKDLLGLLFVSSLTNTT